MLLVMSALLARSPEAKLDASDLQCATRSGESWEGREGGGIKGDGTRPKMRNKAQAVCVVAIQRLPFLGRWTVVLA